MWTTLKFCGRGQVLRQRAGFETVVKLGGRRSCFEAAVMWTAVMF
jgi:hypothetical protein